MPKGYSDSELAVFPVHPEMARSDWPAWTPSPSSGHGEQTSGRPRTGLASALALGAMLVLLVGGLIYWSPAPAASSARHLTGDDEFPWPDLSAPAGAQPLITVDPAGQSHLVLTSAPTGEPTSQIASPANLSPAPHAETARPTHRLGSILRTGAGAWAIVNDRLVQAGDVVDGAKVESIDEHTVVLDRQGEQIVLRL